MFGRKIAGSNGMYIARNLNNQEVIANNLTSWNNLADGIRALHPEITDFDIRTENDTLVYTWSSPCEYIQPDKWNVDRGFVLMEISLDW